MNIAIVTSLPSGLERSQTHGHFSDSELDPILYLCRTCFNEAGLAIYESCREKEGEKGQANLSPSPETR